MDGVSAAANIIALIQITGTVISICYDLRSGKNAPKDAIRISTELRGLRNLLEKALVLADEHDPRLTSLASITTPGGILDDCQIQVYALLKELKAAKSQWGAAKQKILWPMKEADVSKRLQDIERVKADLSLAIDIDQITVTLQIDNNTTVLRKRDDDRELQHILNWICPIDYQEQQRDIISRRREGTGRWFFDSPIFTKWLSSSADTLFCPGDPGMGKTMIAAAVADRLAKVQSDSVGLIQLYCNYKRQHEQTAAHLLGALLRQLIEIRAQIPDAVYDLYKKQQARQKSPRLEDLQALLLSVAGTFSRIYIVIDALDECDDSESSPQPRPTLLAMLQKLQDLGNTKVLCTARKHVTLEEFPDCLSLEIATPSYDIQLYIQQRIPDLAKCVRSNPTLQAEVSQAITQAVNGIFLLAQLSVDSLKGKLTARAVRNTLDRLPRGSNAYHEAYREALQRITNQPDGLSELAQKALSWVAYAERPLAPVELQHALAVEPGDLRLDEDNLAEIDEVIGTCAGLIVRDEKSNTVRLVHLTLQQYLDDTKSDWFPLADAVLATTCLTYLSFELPDPNAGKTSFDSRQRNHLPVFGEERALFQYAADFWGEHLGKSEKDGTLKPETDLYHLAWSVLHNDYQMGRIGSWAMSNSSPKSVYHWFNAGVRAIHLAAYFGIEILLRGLLKFYGQLERTTSNGLRPLWYAAAGGHVAAVQILLDSGADLHAPAEHSAFPLTIASERSHKDIVHLLLERGADVNRVGTYGNSVLTHMCARSNIEMVQFLLDHNADINTQACGRHGSAIMAALSANDEPLVQLLLKRGADVSAVTVLGWPTLLIAAIYCSGQIARLLLLYGADINARHDGVPTALLIACQHGREDIVQIFLDAGADIDAQVDGFDPAVIAAVLKGNEKLVRLLVRRGANVNLRDTHGGSILQTAYLSQLKDLIPFLIESGADVNAQNQHGDTLLNVACAAFDPNTVQVLLDHNARTDIPSMFGQVPLWIAVEEGEARIVRMLLESGADASICGPDGLTLVALAAQRGDEKIIETIAQYTAQNGLTTHHQ